MAVIARRTWAEIRDEVIKRAHGIDVSGFSTRVEHVLWATYLDLCLSYHHFELDVLDTSTLTASISTNQVTLPTNCFIVISVRLRDAATGLIFKGQVSAAPARVLVTEYRKVTGLPTRYCRFGSALHFNFIPSEAFKVDLFYYKTPIAPDFSTATSPETHVEMDEHLIQGCLGTLFPALGRPDLAMAHLDNLHNWVALQTRPAMVAETPAGKHERVETSTSLGGNQG